MHDSSIKTSENRTSEPFNSSNPSSSTSQSSSSSSGVVAISNDSFGTPNCILQVESETKAQLDAVSNENNANGRIKDSFHTPKTIESSETSQTESAIDIVSPDATCRICFVEFYDSESQNQDVQGGQSQSQSHSQDQEWIQLACRCRGDLALAHLSCAIKWFSIKGTKTCDICGAEVNNLPPLPPPPSPNPLHHHHPRHNRHGFMNGSIAEGARTNADGMEEDGPSNSVKIIMAIAASVFYSCFFEQLVARSMGTAGIAISIPFGISVGILTTLQAASQTTASGRWTFAILQFVCIVILAHILYNLTSLTVEVVVLVSSLCGMTLAKLIHGCRFYRSRRARIQSNSNSNGASTNGTVINPSMDSSQANAPPYSSGTVTTAAGLVGSLPVSATNSSVNNREVDQTWEPGEISTFRRQDQVRDQVRVQVRPET